MFNQTEYVKDKIINKLTQSEDYNISFNDSVSKLLENINVGLVPQKSDIFEESIIGWISFCNIIGELISDGLDLTKENFKNKFTNSFLSSKSEKTIERGDDIVNESLLEEECKEEKIKRLLSIAEDCDLFDSYEEQFLTEEGLRARGVISSDSTSLDGEDIQSDSQKEIKIFKLKKNEEIISPYTGSKEVYQISSSLYMDIENEQTFYVEVVED
jgi:hypothetical protein